MHASDKMVKEELKIVGWVKLMRCTEVAMKRLFKPEEWAEIEKQAMYRIVELPAEEYESDNNSSKAKQSNVNKSVVKTN